MPGKRGKSGQKKDPNAPKKPTTAFFAFLADKRQTYTKEHPEAKITEISKGLSEVWRGLTDEQKKLYDERAAADKKRYEKEMQSYTPPEAPEDDGTNEKAEKAAKKKKDPNAPKKALSSYMLFSIAEGPKIRAGNKGEAKAAMGLIAEAWKAADKATKDKFEKQAEEDKKRYAREITAYKGKGKVAEEDGEDDEGEDEEDEEVMPAPKKRKAVVSDDDDE